MDVALVVVGIALGIAVGLRAGLGWRMRDRAVAVDVALDEGDGLSPGVGQVLIVLRSLAVVLDTADRVVKASPAAYSFGIVRAQSLVASDLLQLVADVRR